MKLKPGLGAFCTIRPGNEVGLFYSSTTHTGLTLIERGIEYMSGSSVDFIVIS